MKSCGSEVEKSQGEQRPASASLPLLLLLLPIAEYAMDSEQLFDFGILEGGCNCSMVLYKRFENQVSYKLSRVKKIKRTQLAAFV